MVAFDNFKWDSLMYCFARNIIKKDWAVRTKVQYFIYWTISSSQYKFLNISEVINKLLWKYFLNISEVGIVENGKYFGKKEEFNLKKLNIKVFNCLFKIAAACKIWSQKIFFEDLFWTTEQQSFIFIFLFSRFSKQRRLTQPQPLSCIFGNNL